MKTLNYALSVLMIPFIISAQYDYRAEMMIYGAYDNFAVLPSGKVHIATKVGMTYYVNAPDDIWHLGQIQNTESDFSGEHMDRVQFFNDSIGIISGYLHEEDMSKTYIYRTTDGGMNWHKMYIDQAKWIDAQDIDTTGNIWMASSDQVIHFSDDFGENWNIIDRPENETNQRIITIDFVNENEGIAGTGWDRLYYTTDNGKSWTLLPTPRQQEKYEIGKRERPRIEKVTLTGQQIFVKQKDLIFYTDKDSIDWKFLEGVYDFAYHNRKIYLFRNRGRGICFQEEIYTGDCKEYLRYNGLINRYEFQNNQLFITKHNSLEVFNGDTLIAYPIYTNDYDILDCGFVKIMKGSDWAIGENSFYHFHPIQERFYRINSNPVSAANIYPLDENKAILTSNSYETHQLYDTSTDMQTDIAIKDYISLPAIKRLKSVRFEKGEYGCFHYDVDAVTYRLKNDKLKIGEIESGLSIKSVASLKLQQKFNLPALVQLLDLIETTESNYDKTQVLQNMSFDQLLDRMDKDTTALLVEKLKSDGIDDTFLLPYHSGSTNWGEKKITLEYANDFTVTLLSSNRTYNNVDLNWVIDVNGLKYRFKGLALWQYFYTALYPHHYEKEKERLAKYLYDDFSGRKKTSGYD